MPTYNFSLLPNGNTYTIGNTINANGATIELKRFQWGNGTWTAGGAATVTASSFADGSPTQELNLNNIMVRVIPNTPGG